MNTAILITALALAATPDNAEGPTRQKKAPSPQTLAAAQMILDQRVPPCIRAGGPQVVGANPQDPTAQNAANLVDLIQSTIAPNSWHLRGGQGVIVYFSPGSVIVVRQTGDAHGAVGDVLQQLRPN